MDEGIIFILPVIFFFLIMLFAISMDSETNGENSKASVKCVEAGGTWNIDKEICESKR